MDPLAPRAAHRLDAPLDLTRVEWFCARHAEPAEELWYLSRNEAVEKLRPHGPRRWLNDLEEWLL